MYIDQFIKLSVGLAALLIVIRLLGKKELAQLTPFDFVYILVLGGILEESLFDEKVNVGHFLFSLFIWAFLIYLIEKATKRWNNVRILLKGRPARLIENGQLNMKEFDRNHLDMEQLRSALRQQDVFSLREVRDVILEPSGQVTVNKFAQHNPATNGNLNIKAAEEDPSYLLIDEGVIKEDVLSLLGKTEDWLQQELTENGHTDNVEKIAYGEWSKTDGLFIKTY